jgi:glycerate 2-kinase
MGPRELLLAMFKAAVDAAHAARCVPEHLPPSPRGRTIVVGAGKAAAAMARAVEDHWRGPLTGLVITRYAHSVPCKHIEVVEAGHPVPDDAGQAAAERMLRLVADLTADDLVLCLISGGGSSLLSLSPRSVPAEDKRAVTRALLLSGATIADINCVRKHLSRIKGGRLAAAASPAKVVSLVISDVPGDQLSVIASGPTVADTSTRHDALAVLNKYKIATPRSVSAWLNDPAAETLKPGDARLAAVQNILIARPYQSLLAAADIARSAGCTPLILGDAIEGEARECAIVHAGIAKSCLMHGEPVKPPCVLISGGETSVTVRGKGRGGRNAEFLLSLGLNLKARTNVWALACDTDGIDGTETNAGAIIGPEFLQAAADRKLDAAAYLANNDAFTLFEQLGALVTTGPTLTNVNDFRAIWIGR